jgi:hypothetical protein
MKFPRLRFTVRRLMAAVAIVALAFHVEQTWRRWLFYRERAAFRRTTNAGAGLTPMTCADRSAIRSESIVANCWPNTTSP